MTTTENERTDSGAWARDLDGDGEMEYAGANPLYLGISASGVAMVIASLMTWATSYDAIDVAVSGMERAGLATMIVGTALAVLGLVGWAYNPWSDPEAGWSLVLSAIALAVVIWQMIDITGSLRAPDIGGGLWLAGAAAAAAAALSAVVLFAPDP